MAIIRLKFKKGNALAKEALQAFILGEQRFITVCVTVTLPQTESSPAIDATVPKCVRLVSPCPGEATGGKPARRSICGIELDPANCRVG
jgi:hypothetical protein